MATGFAASVLCAQASDQQVRVQLSVVRPSNAVEIYATASDRRVGDRRCGVDMA
jgi:hypothetical protein